jgi:hypothetical protein
MPTVIAFKDGKQVNQFSKWYTDPLPDYVSDDSISLSPSGSAARASRQEVYRRVVNICICFSRHQHEYVTTRLMRVREG